MKKRTEIKITTYDAGDGFLVDIVERINNGEPIYEAFLYRDDNGVKDLMFGYFKKNTTRKEFMEMVECSLYEYEAQYDDDRAADERRFWEEIVKEREQRTGA